MQRVAFHANDCGPGGRVLLLKAQQASSLGKPEAVPEILAAEDEAATPMGTRCHLHGVTFLGEAELLAQERK